VFSEEGLLPGDTAAAASIAGKKTKEAGFDANDIFFIPA